LQAHIAMFNRLKEQYLLPLLPQELQIYSESPIQAIVLPGIEWGQKVAAVLRQKGYELRLILAPTVPEGKERLRICLHVYNTEEEIKGLVQALAAAL
jgi:8-amino-7-oxononanoate synthase